MYILDTHILLWWLNGSDRLPMHIRKILNERDRGIFISAVTVWEISIKNALKKLQVASSFFDDIKNSQFSELPISFKHAQAVRNLPDFHQDPFDRMLIAQAQVEHLALITGDKNILRYKVSTLKV